MNSTDTYQSEISQQELAAGVLKHGDQDLRRFHRATTRVERELYVDGYRWVVFHDCSWPFSFLNVCRLLNLVPENIAAELIADVSLGMFSQCEFPR